MTATATVRLVVVVALLSAASGCGRSGPGTDGRPDPSDPAVVKAHLKMTADLAVDAGLPTLADALTDGVLTEAEYRQAYVDLIDCWHREGIEAEIVRLDTIHGFDFKSTAIAPMESGATCWKIEELANSAWNFQINDYLSPEAVGLTRDCLDNLDVDTSAATTLSDFRASGPWATVRACLREAALTIADGRETVITF